MKKLAKIELHQFLLENGKTTPFLPLYFETFGQILGAAPVVVVNHALTGNSTVTGEKGWWNELIGYGKLIDLDTYTVIAFNIPGNGYDGILGNLISNYHDYTVRDIARMFWQGLQEVKVEQIFALIGGSLGGAIAWEMAVLQPHAVQHLIPIATDWKATDWVLANVQVQEQILNNSVQPIEDARQHAMLLYRTPQSINARFNRQQFPNGEFAVENWLTYHGVQLKNRFRLSAYKLMNHLLKTNDITRNRGSLEEVVASIEATIHIVSVDTDLFFTARENRKTVMELASAHPEIYYHEIQSIHGHDAFLIEFEQLITLLKPVFTTQNQRNYANA
ncbi:alpha/beta fold hydrolase [Flavobacterium sp.]|jgi:homoserine O-acetyltransferase|uniref:alpha/beta fold hydrolase n=1 Tax=Flavobacterium sp. TaxID=239 RepID=UPI0022CA7A32|nr:alpha/beta fold hydrolase [Flavobacterium sp.]MCZ8146056.1 alpha/beta fold hydrolase [Flavobacterium sp.]MCZ8367596.1 alpha/beta fold hydrolase [Flavobacterium sp.]